MQNPLLPQSTENNAIFNNIVYWTIFVIFIEQLFVILNTVKVVSLYSIKTWHNALSYTFVVQAEAL